jgi:hypothetical protein
MEYTISEALVDFLAKYVNRYFWVENGLVISTHSFVIKSVGVIFVGMISGLISMRSRGE